MPYVILDKAAAGCGTWGTYRRVAVVEIEPGADMPRMISTRCRGVVRIVRLWDKLNVGATEKCAYSKALCAARELQAQLCAKEGAR